MKTTRSTLICSVVMLSICRDAAPESPVYVPLETRLQEAELVVIGTLTSIERHEFKLSHKEHTTYYDVGQIQVEEVLKSSSKIRDRPISVPFAFVSRDQPEHPKSSQIPLYENGQRGVWLLTFGPMGWFCAGFHKFLLMEEAPKVKAALDELVRSHLPARVVTQKEGGIWSAHIEVHEAETRRTAETRDAAIGMVVRDFPKLLHIELHTDEPD